jgi:hypothetical protein
LVVGFFALRKTRRRAQRQATESFANQKVAIPQSDRCAVNVWPQRDQTHHTRFRQRHNPISF